MAVLHQRPRQGPLPRVRPGKECLWVVLPRAGAVQAACSASRRHRCLDTFRTPQEPETERKQLTFADFAACAREWRARKVLLRATLACPQSVAHPRPKLTDEDGDTGPAASRAMAPALHEELDTLIDWAWMRAAFQAPCRFGGVLDVTLVACSASGLQPAKIVYFDTLLCQVRGVRARMY